MLLRQLEPQPQLPDILFVLTVLEIDEGREVGDGNPPLEDSSHQGESSENREREKNGVLVTRGEFVG